MEFFADGTVVLHRFHRSGAGEYAFVEPGRVVIRFGPPFGDASVGDFRVQVRADTARLCETYRPHRCLSLVRAAADWIEPPGIWVDTVPLRLAEPPRVGEEVDRRVTVASMQLQAAHAMQDLFRQERGRYGRTLNELAEVGWQRGPASDYALEIVRADDGLCMVARPRGDSLPPLYVSAAGQVGFGAACP